MLGALGAVAVLPYTLALYPARAAQLPLPSGVLALASAGQSFVLLLALCWLDSPLARALVERRPVPRVARTLLVARVAGLLTGGGLLALDLLFAPLLPPTAQGTLPAVVLWKGLLVSFYGGITEELLLRLFLMTLVAWLIGRIFSRSRRRFRPRCSGQRS